MRKYIIALLIMVIAFDGLNNLREVTDLAIVKAIGIDMTEDGQYKTTAIVIDTSNKEAQNEGIIYESIGESVHDSARKIVNESPKKLYLAQMETLVLSEDIAKNNFEDTLGFFIRDNEGSNAFYLFVANGCAAGDFVKSINEEQINIKSLLNTSAKYRGNCNLNSLNDILKDKMKPGIDITINSATIDNENIKISDMAYFKGWSMKGYLTDQESILYNLLCNNLNNTILVAGQSDDRIGAEIISSKTSMSLDKENNNKINFNIKIKANISETGSNVRILNSEQIEDAQNSLEERVKADVNDFLLKIKNEYDSDIIGFGNLMYRKKDDLYKEENYLSQIETDVNVEVDIQNQGGVTKKW